MALDFTLKSLKDAKLQVPILNVMVMGSKSKPVGRQIAEIVFHVVQQCRDKGVVLTYGVCDMALEFMAFLLTIKTGITWIFDALHVLNCLRTNWIEGKTIKINGETFKGIPQPAQSKLSISGNTEAAVNQLKLFFLTRMERNSKNFSVQKRQIVFCVNFLRVVSS